jgi:hypothetical protein
MISQEEIAILEEINSSVFDRYAGCKVLMDKALAKLSSAGLIVVDGNKISLTDKGRKQLK